MYVWKVTVPKASAILCSRGSSRRIRVMAVRYVDCGFCAVDLKQKYPDAVVDQVETPDDADVVICPDDGAQENAAIAGVSA